MLLDRSWKQHHKPLPDPKYQFFVEALVKYFVFEAVNNFLSFLSVTQIQEDECLYTMFPKCRATHLGVCRSQKKDTFFTTNKPRGASPGREDGISTNNLVSYYFMV